MGIDFPTATTVGQTYTDPTSGNTYVVTVVGPPAQWVGSGSSTNLDSTYLRKDASNDPVTGTLTITPSTNVEGLVVTQPSGNSAAALRITNEGSGNSLVIEDSASTDSTPIVADSAGRLLVGSTTARANLFNTTSTSNFQLEGTATPGRVATIISSSSGAAEGGVLALAHQKSGTLGGNTLVADGDTLGYFTYLGSDGTEFVEAAGIYGQVDGTPGANDMPGRLVFATTADGASSPTERMRITNAGRISVNTTNPGTSRMYVEGATSDVNVFYAQRVGGTTASNAVAGYNAPAAGAAGTYYGVNGQYVAQTGVPGGGTLGLISSVFGILGYYDTANSWAGYFNGSTYATGSYQGSDARLKDVIEPISGGILDKLSGIQAVKYQWKENTDQRKAIGDKTQIGLIAQEVEQYFPELVAEVEQKCAVEGQEECLNHELGTIKSLEYAHMVAVLVEALKEAKVRIESLEAKVSALEGA